LDLSLYIGLGKLVGTGINYRWFGPATLGINTIQRSFEWGAM